MGDKTHPQFRSIVLALKKKALVKGMTCFILFIQQVFTKPVESVNPGKEVRAGKVE